jgi:diaminopimelate epimerase
LALPDGPPGGQIEAVSNGERILLRRDASGIGIRLPEGEGFGLRPVPIALPGPAGFGWVGNPQLVMEVPSVDAVDLPAFAPPLRGHASIPGGTNVNVVEVLAPGQARIRSWERGVEGETLCCGTGCAVAAAWLAQRTGQRQWHLLPASGEAVTVSLALDAQGRWHDLWLSGPVCRIGTARPDEALLALAP